MASKKTIVRARIPGFKNLQCLKINSQGMIAEIAPQVTAEDLKSTIDLEGDWLSLGGIDLQINGGLGLAFTDLELTNFSQLQKICGLLWLQGVDGFLPTIVTTSITKIQRSLAVLAEYIDARADIAQTAKILGVHLEGPFLNYEKRGAHPAEYLLPLTIDKIERVLGAYSQIVKIITLAPELDDRDLAIPYLRQHNIIVSLGHSLATARQAKRAFQLGASMVTHAFNAMPGLHHRQPGLLGEAIINPNVYCGLIADGNHVCPTMLKIFLRASNYERGIFLVSDALSPLGLPDGIYPWDTREIEVTQGTARLKNGTLSGTTLPLMMGVKNLAEWGICNLETAIAMATESPRKAIALSGIGIGQPANFLRWHWDENLNQLTWKRLNLT